VGPIIRERIVGSVLLKNNSRFGALAEMVLWSTAFGKGVSRAFDLPCDGQKQSVVIWINLFGGVDFISGGGAVFTDNYRPLI
jgi:hypothetical protein